LWRSINMVYILTGLSLAMAEMAMVLSLYRKYRSSIKPGFEEIAPGIASGLEVVTDEIFTKMKVSNIAALHNTG
jgi:hypothetical protein